MSAPEHNFGEDVLISGDKLRSYTADGSIGQHKAVTINGDYQVTQVSTAGASGDGVAAYDVATGEEVPVAGDDTEVRVIAGGACTAGSRATVDANGDFVDAATGDEVWGTFNTGGADGDIVELALETEKQVS